MNINLHIDRLVLEDINLSPGQRELLQGSVTAELTRLLNDRGLAKSLTGGVALPSLTANHIQLTDNQPRQLGQQIAQSVYGGIGRE